MKILDYRFKIANIAKIWRNTLQQPHTSTTILTSTPIFSTLVPKQHITSLTNTDHWHIIEYISWAAEFSRMNTQIFFSLTSLPFHIYSTDQSPPASWCWHPWPWLETGFAGWTHVQACFAVYWILLLWRLSLWVRSVVRLIHWRIHRFFRKPFFWGVIRGSYCHHSDHAGHNHCCDNYDNWFHDHFCHDRCYYGRQEYNYPSTRNRQHRQANWERDHSPGGNTKHTHSQIIYQCDSLCD